jgi:hypothetical protein
MKSVLPVSVSHSASTGSFQDSPILSSCTIKNDASVTLVVMFKVFLESWKVPRDFPFQNPLYAQECFQEHFDELSRRTLKIAIVHTVSFTTLLPAIRSPKL